MRAVSRERKRRMVTGFGAISTQTSLQQWLEAQDSELRRMRQQG